MTSSSSAWTEPGPFRFEGEHYDYRYVNPWARPYQQPHPLIMIPGVVSRNTVDVGRRAPLPLPHAFATRLEPTKQSFDYYREVAEENGYEAGPQHIGYLFKVHVDETEELAYETGKKFLEGPGNIFLEGSRGNAPRRELQNLPGLTDRKNLLPTAQLGAVAASRGRDADQVAKANPKEKQASDGGAKIKPGERPLQADYDAQLENHHDHLRHARHGAAQDPARAGVPAARHDLLLGR